jgi:tetratricopeptide (TPR) repeat protein
LQVQPDFKEVRDLLSDLRVSRNDFDGAIDVAQDAIKNNPRDPNNFYRLSQILTQQWRLREADTYLDKAIRLSPDNARYHRAKASILRYQHKLPEAIAEQEKAVKLGNDKTFELTELAALNELNGNDSAAADNLREAIQNAPVTQSAYSSAQQKLLQLLTRGKRYDDLIKEYQRAIQAQPANGTLRLGLAEAYLKQNKIEEAMKELKEASNADQADPRPHRMLGAYTRALNINPGSVEDLVALGFTYAQNDEYTQAETAFVTALALQQLTNAQGSRVDVLRSLATLLLTEGRYTEAALNYEEILRSHKTAMTEKQDTFLLAETRALRDRTATSVKEMVDAFGAMMPAEQSTYRVPFIDALLKLGKPDIALEQIGKADGQSEAQMLTLQARAYRMKGDLAKATELITKALESKQEESDESRADVFTENANILLAKGDVAGADAAIRKATELDSKLFPAYEVMGRIYLKRNEHDRAIEAAKRALDINPYYEPAYMLTGDAYAASNKMDLAVTNYKRAVELYPSSLDAHKGLRDAYKKQANKDEVSREDETIARLEKES